MIGVLKPTLVAELGWSETDYANIVFFFQLAYAIGYIGFGRDRRRARRAARLCHRLRHLAGRAHGAWRGLDASPSSPSPASALGIGESGNFPAGIKAVTEWFPAARARLRDRPVQRRRQHRRDRDAAGRAVADGRLRLAQRLRDHRRRRPALAGRLVGPLSPPARESQGRRRPSLRGSSRIRRTPRRRSPGAGCCGSRRPGPLRWASSSSTRSGGSSSSGCPAISATATGSTCSNSARRWSRSICSRTSAASPAAGCRAA